LIFCGVSGLRLFGNQSGVGQWAALLNRSSEDVIYLEVGDRSAGDSVVYPDDDLQAVFVEGK